MSKVFMALYIWFFRTFPEHIKFGGGMRNFCVKRFVKQAGDNINIGYGARVHKNTIIGNQTGIGRNCELQNGVVLGNKVLMGPDVYVLTQNHRFDDLTKPILEQGMTEVKPVVIEDDVWIGARVVILPGVRIGHGSIIAACSVVTKNIPPMVVAGGCPAKVIKTR